MSEEINQAWHYAPQGQTLGPATVEQIRELAKSGVIRPDTPVWRHGLESWTAAALVEGLLPPPPRHSLPPIPPPPAPGQVVDIRKGLMGRLGARISAAADLPTISNMPVRDMLLGGLNPTAKASIEDIFAVGTERTTPPLAIVPTGWPMPRVFWRILFGSLAVYILLRIVLSQWGNVLAVPGMVAIGSFVMPMAIVVFFFEVNTPRNVSIYQAAKMTLLGGALSLVTTMAMFDFFTASGTGNFFAALLTGVAEETGKMLALLLVAGVVRYRWQLNGLLFGAAVGAGFAGFESAGYAFHFGYQSAMDTLAAIFPEAYASAGNELANAFAIASPAALDAAIVTANEIVFLRGILSPGGHVIWTAMIGSAIWKVKGEEPFRFSMLFHKIVLRRWLVAVVLHGLWDTDIPFLHIYLHLTILIIVGWYVIFAILKEALAEVETAKKALGYT